MSLIPCNLGRSTLIRPARHITWGCKFCAKLLHATSVCDSSCHQLCEMDEKIFVSNYLDRPNDHSVTNIPQFYQVSNTTISGCFSISQNRSFIYHKKDWQELRRYKLTASTFGGAIGLWKGRREQLWLEKLGLLEPFFGNSSTHWEKVKEKVALQQYILITRNDVQFVDFKVYNQENIKDNWLAASPDGIVTNSSSQGILEIKCPFYQGDKVKMSPWFRVPVHCMPQAQGLMEILDKEWLDLYCCTPKGSSLFRIHRDQNYWCLLKMALSDFWWKHVHPARVILSRTSIEESREQLMLLKPTQRHELCNDIACASRHLVKQSKLLMATVN